MAIDISVITPSFRQGKFIERTIQSVVDQSVQQMEYVVCDAVSEDETLDILKQYGNRLCWISEPDQGQADAVNKGIAMTSGDIVAWINSDDVYYPQAFKRVLAFFEEHPDIAGVYGQADWIDEFDNIIAPYPTKPWSYRQLTKECYLCQPAVFFRRTLIRELGDLNAQLQYCMDYELWLRYGQKHSFAYLPIKLAGSRLYASNKTFGGRLEAHREANDMLKEKLGYSTQNWIFGYSKLQAQATAESKTPRLAFFASFLVVAIANCWHLNKKAMPIVLLKVIVYQIFANSELLKSRQAFDIENIVLSQRE